MSRPRSMIVRFGLDVTGFPQHFTRHQQVLPLRDARWLYLVERTRIEVAVTGCSQVPEGFPPCEDESCDEDRFVIQIGRECTGDRTPLSFVVCDLGSGARVATNASAKHVSFRDRPRGSAQNVPYNEEVTILDPQSRHFHTISVEVLDKAPVSDLEAQGDDDMDLAMAKRFCAEVANGSRHLASRIDLPNDVYGHLSTAPDWHTVRMLCRNAGLPQALYPWASHAAPADLRLNPGLPLYLGSQTDAALDRERLWPDDETKRSFGYGV